MSRDRQSVFDEPHFRDAPRAEDAVEHEVWEEPGLMPNAHPPDASSTYAGRLCARWLEADAGLSWLTVAGLALVAGPFAVFAAFLKTSALCFAVGAVIIAPLVEELGKVAAPLMLLECKPYRFVSAVQPVLVCVASGLVFAVIENLLYLHVYVQHPGSAFALWRWTVCTALHVGCSLIAGLGLRRIWIVSRATFTHPDVSKSAPYFITAMALHGAYNAAALVLQQTHVLSFGS